MASSLAESTAVRCRIATRYDKTIASYASFVAIASFMI
jgi:hypothetical protein